MLCCAREMVSLIPRLSSLAVSGTPARTHVADLLHVFKYVLRHHYQRNAYGSVLGSCALILCQMPPIRGTVFYFQDFPTNSKNFYGDMPSGMLS